jgi:CRP-like cAMP-binding protein
MNVDKNTERAFWANGRRLTFAVGETLIDETSDPAEVFLLLKGRVMVTGVSPTGRFVIYEELEGRTVFGELAAIDDAPRCASVVAVSDVDVLALPIEKFRSMLWHDPALALHVISRLAIALRRSDDRIRDLCTMSARARIARELGRLVRVGGVTGRETVIPIMPSHQNLAARCGTTRETVTRALSDLQGRGLILFESGAVRVPDHDALIRAYDDTDSPPDAQSGRPRRSRC